MTSRSILLESFICTGYSPRLQGRRLRIAFATLIGVFCSIIVRVLSQDLASLFSLMKRVAKIKLSHLPIQIVMLSLSKHRVKKVYLHCLSFSIIEHVLSQDGASHFFLMKLW